jgi:uncharacterized protein involved in exopolysaccharide biosynthesis
MVEVSQIVGAIRRNWILLGAATLFGIGAAVVVLWLAPPVWTANAAVLVHQGSSLTGGLEDQLGAAGARAATLLGGDLRSSVETDIALMRSRELIGEVVDSLRLQVVVADPAGTPSASVVTSTRLATTFRPLKLKLERTPAGMIHLRGPNLDTTVAPETDVPLKGGTIRFAKTIPSSLTLRVLDREDAITRADKRLDVARRGGEVVRVSWRGDDSLSAPAAANLLIERYLLRRRDVDASTDQHRLEFVNLQIDSVDRALNVALRSQRMFHEQAQTVDPGVSAKTFLEALVRAREQRQGLAMEEGALSHLQDQLRAHNVQPRQLAAYPAFLRSPAINELLGKIGGLEAQRVALLEKQHTDNDPEVVAIRASVANLEGQLEPLARTYYEAIANQRATVDAEIARMSERLAQMPVQVEAAFQHARDVERLAKTSLALNAQRVSLRLATVSEGGQARVVDVARPQWQKSFPSKPITLLLGLIAGGLLGIGLSLGRAYNTPRRA